ncbi:right-handed parallel beta-helix repeat-containing protein [Candidatus Bathyarchaeota archaeon]|nr:right-handed parallel beta-helix repeat-containing protein [Candidatus Bathyarchaeota archaeon]
MNVKGLLRNILVWGIVALLLGATGLAFFKVNMVAYASGTIYIRSNGLVEGTNKITNENNVTYTLTDDIADSIVVERSNIIVDGDGYAVNGSGTLIYGFNLTSVSNVTIRNLNVMGFGYGIYLQSSILNIILENNITFNEGNIYLENSSDNTITDNTITDGVEAVQLYASSNNTILGNSMSENNIGVWVRFNSADNVISGNNITENNNSGIYISESSNNTISENDIANNSVVIGGSGIMLDNSSNNTISRNNIIANNWWGINPSSSNNNTIFGNDIRNNSVGINSASSDFNIVSANNIIDNEYLGIYLEESSNNTFHHNNLINNTNQVVVDLSYANKWDDGIEGNYWSNYTGVDLSHDGIGDTPQVIDANDTDYYPLMGMFHCFNTSLGKQVNIISNSTIESFQYFASNSTITMHVSNMTANQTHGFCRVSIPYEVMSEPFNVTIDGANPTYWNYTLYDNGTHGWIYFEYEHTTREIEIIPDLRALTIISLLMMATLLIAIISRRKRTLSARNKTQFPFFSAHALLVNLT